MRKTTTILAALALTGCVTVQAPPGQVQVQGPAELDRRVEVAMCAAATTYLGANPQVLADPQEAPIWLAEAKFWAGQSTKADVLYAVNAFAEENLSWDAVYDIAMTCYEARR